VRLVSGDTAGLIKRWDPMNGDYLGEVKRHGGRVSSLCAHEKMVCSGGDDASIKLWDAQSLTCRGTLTGHTSYV
jgi:F-box/WD-40 domain protein 7